MQKRKSKVMIYEEKDQFPFVYNEDEGEDKGEENSEDKQEDTDENKEEDTNSDSDE